MEGESAGNGYMCIYGWVSLLSTWNCHNIINWLCCYLAAQSCPTLLQAHGLWPARILCPWDSPGKNTGVGYHALHQGIFLAQGSNQHLLGLLYWQANSPPSEPSIVRKSSKIVFRNSSTPKPHTFPVIKLGNTCTEPHFLKLFCLICSLLIWKELTTKFRTKFKNKQKMIQMKWLIVFLLPFSSLDAWWVHFANSHTPEMNVNRDVKRCLLTPFKLHIQKWLNLPYLDPNGIESSAQRFNEEEPIRIEE